MVFGLRLGLLSQKSSSALPPASDEPPPTAAPVGAPGGGGKAALTVNEFVAKTKRSREKGLEPTKPELISYAKYLGIDPVIDGDLMWVADEALKAPLPCEWTEHHDSAERIFYYNVETHESSWTHPLEQLHRDTYKAMAKFRGGSLSKEEQLQELERLRKKCEASEWEAHQELQSWTEHTDEQGQRFYYNKSNKRSVWTDPRPARCHSLYLQMKALRVVARHCGQEVVQRQDAASEKRLSQSRCGPTGPMANQHLDDALAKPPSSPNRGASRGQSVSPPMGSESKKGKKDGKAKSRGKSLNGFNLEEVSGDMRTSGNLSDFKKPFVLDLTQDKGLSVSASLPLLNSGSPVGEGLSNVGRAKVRAGIRLEPLKGGA